MPVDSTSLSIMEMQISEPDNGTLTDAVVALLGYQSDPTFDEITYDPQTGRISVATDESKRGAFETVVTQLDPGAERVG